VFDRLFISTAIACAALAAHAAELVTLATRPEVTQSYLLYVKPGVAPKAVALLFAGGEGNVRLSERGATNLRGNFLVRSVELFRDDEVAAAIVDAPSDLQQLGMSDGFRTGGDHARDIEAVVTDVRKRLPGARVFLVGTSRGTLSAAYAARALGDRIDGVVLSSSVFTPTRNSIALAGFPFGSIRAPILFVHHKDDGCEACCSYRETRWIGDYPLITAHGGATPKSGPCEGQSRHGYIGIEAAVIDAIKAFMLERPYPREIR
jgi:hypothetical protein